MTFFDAHTKRVPRQGSNSYLELESVDIYNHAMLDVEKRILHRLHISADSLACLRHNRRALIRTDSPHLGPEYYVVPITEHDVACIVPHQLKQNRYDARGQGFSQVRHGSQVDLIVPLSRRFDFPPVQDTGGHVEAGSDPVIRVREKVLPPLRR